jgi:5-methyltetrahydropteroyltriglutamate--homocysteine methyltransferase
MAPPMRITIPTDPMGSLPRPLDVIERAAKGESENSNLDPQYEDAIRGTIERFEAGLLNMGRRFQDPFSGGHTRWLARLPRGPFRYSWYADSYLDVAMRRAHGPVIEALISSLALSLRYPAERIPDYSREQFSEELLNDHETETRRCLRKGAHAIQVDVTEGWPGREDRPTH